MYNVEYICSLIWMHVANSLGRKRIYQLQIQSKKNFFVGLLF